MLQTNQDLDPRRLREIFGIFPSGVAVPLMLGAGPTHALAPELTLRPVLTEIGGTVPVRGLYVHDTYYDDPAAYTSWLETARPRVQALLPTPEGALA